MKRMRTATLSLAILIGVAALVPAAASATLPAPKTAVIKPFEGIGAVRSGSIRRRRSESGAPGNRRASQSSGAQTCSWFASSSTDYPIESGSLQISPGGDVCGILIRAGTNSSSGNLTITGLKKWKTKGAVSTSPPSVSALEDQRGEEDSREARRQEARRNDGLRGRHMKVPAESRSKRSRSTRRAARSPDRRWPASAPSTEAVPRSAPIRSAAPQIV